MEGEVFIPGEALRRERINRLEDADAVIREMLSTGVHTVGGQRARLGPHQEAGLQIVRGLIELEVTNTRENHDYQP
jgi:hypothetical protein